MKASIVILKKFFLLTILIITILSWAKFRAELGQLNFRYESGLSSFLAVRLRDKINFARDLTIPLREDLKDRSTGMTTEYCSQVLALNKVSFVLIDGHYKKYILNDHFDFPPWEFLLQSEGLYHRNDKQIIFIPYASETMEKLPLKFFKMKSLVGTAIDYYGDLMYGSNCTANQIELHQEVREKFKASRKK
jgi:hypothetical protein